MDGAGLPIGSVEIRRDRAIRDLPRNTRQGWGETRHSEPVRQREPIAIGISEPRNATAFTRWSPHSV